MLRPFIRKAVFVLAALLAVSLPAAASWNEARQVVDDTSASMFRLMESDDFRQAERFDRLLTEVDSLLGPVVDFSYISKRVMGKYYRRASSEERGHFTELFRATLLKTYAKAMVGFDIQNYAIVPPRKQSPQPNKQIVTVEVASSAGTKYTLIYYMLKQADGWRLVNVILDGVNLRLTFKNQFSDLAQKQRGNISRTIVAWKQHIDPGESADHG
ncbi:MAG: MlaC/ttg2D family ABC transporter substrate-binding protein [Pontibacterium sp.]